MRVDDAGSTGAVAPSRASRRDADAGVGFAARLGRSEARGGGDGAPATRGGPGKEAGRRERREAVRVRGPDGAGAHLPVGDRLLEEAVGASPARAESLSRAAGAPLLARAVERLAVVASLQGLPALEVRLGASLALTLTQGTAGIEVRLAVPRGLSPLAEAELPHLLAALRANGIRVARAEVRSGGRGSEGSGHAARRRPGR